MVARKNSNSTDAPADNKAPVLNEGRTDWSKVNDFNDVDTYATENNLSILSGALLFGDGAELLEKSALVGVPFKILEWRFITDEKTQRNYVTVLAMAVRQTPEGPLTYKVRFNDGSTGVMAQLAKVVDDYGPCIIECRNGLRKSDYTFEDSSGRTQAATTYYLT